VKDVLLGMCEIGSGSKRGCAPFLTHCRANLLNETLVVCHC